MDIEKQIVDQRIKKLVDENPLLFNEKDPNRNVSIAFLMLGISSYLNIDLSETEQYITDGGADGGFDAAYIEEAQDSQLHVVLFQSKYVRDLNKDSNFPANAVEKAVNTVRSVFDPNTKIDLNSKSRSVVEEIRSFILDGYVPYVTFVMINNGLPWNQDGENHIKNSFDNRDQVKFMHYSHMDIVDYVKRTKDIKAQIAFSGNAIQENFNYKRVILGRLSVKEIHKLMDDHGDALLEKNIRRYLGRNIVNDNIALTLENDEKRQNFFFFNNGITMICDKFSFNGLQKENWLVRVEKLQIINGGQTCRTIHQILSANTAVDYSQVYVLVRLYEVSDDEKMIQDITYATNSQNPVDFRDLKSNDEKQVVLEQSSELLGYAYKRKKDNQTVIDAIPSTVAAEAVLAIWRPWPHIAKYKKQEYFDKYYDLIFDNLNAAQMVIAVVIFRYCDAMRKRISIDIEIQAQRPYSQYFLAHMIGKLLLDHFEINLDQLTHKNFNEIKQYYEDNKELLYEKAQTMLISILKSVHMSSLHLIDGRTMAALFRRFDIFQSYLNNEQWWNGNARSN